MEETVRILEEIFATAQLDGWEIIVEHQIVPEDVLTEPNVLLPIFALPK